MTKRNNQQHSNGSTLSGGIPYYDSANFNSKKLPVKEAFGFPKFSAGRRKFHRS